MDIIILNPIQAENLIVTPLANIFGPQKLSSDRRNVITTGIPGYEPNPPINFVEFVTLKYLREYIARINKFVWRGIQILCSRFKTLESGLER